MKNLIRSRAFVVGLLAAGMTAPAFANPDRTPESIFTATLSPSSLA